MCGDDRGERAACNSIMASDDDHSPVTANDAKRLFADWKGTPAMILAVSGGPDSMALLWLAARWRRAMVRGPRLVAVTIDHALRPEARREARVIAERLLDRKWV